MSDVRVLLVADTHLGFDMPQRPRVRRRRRGKEFFSNYLKALEPAFHGEVDLVVHGGDLLYRSRVPASLVDQALEPLRALAAQGVHVFFVPGNHERGALPYPLLAWGVHVFHNPHTFSVNVRGTTVAVSGFPFFRHIGRRIAQTVEQCGARGADIHLLCMHQAVEGARVGAHDYCFRQGDDVVSARALPRRFAAVLSGHIHRSQTIDGEPVAPPVIYPGATTKTSFAERLETKGYRLLTFSEGGVTANRFVELPSRPMRILRLDVDGRSGAWLRRSLGAGLTRLEPDAIVDIRLTGSLSNDAAAAVTAKELRRIAPGTMNISCREGKAPKNSG